MGIVYYGRYFEFFEAGRNDMLRKIGYPYSGLEENNIALPVIETAAKYISTAKYDDEILIKTFLKQIPTVRIKIEYELFVNEKLIVTGYTVHSFVNFITLKPTRPPEDFVKLVKEKFTE
jgi:acyl-CoA thioester hydrolase